MQIEQNLTNYILQINIYINEIKEFIKKDYGIENIDNIRIYTYNDFVDIINDISSRFITKFD